MNKKNDTFPINTLSAIDLEKSLQEKTNSSKSFFKCKEWRSGWLTWAKRGGKNYMFLYDSRNNPPRQW